MPFEKFIIMIVVFVGLSLFCSYILFKVLGSSAIVKDKKRKVQLGGAIAGFVVILVLLLQTYQAWDKGEIEKYKYDNNIEDIHQKAYDEGYKKAEKEWKPEVWSICADKVVKENSDQGGNGDYSAIKGRAIPARIADTESNGYFLLEDVNKISNEPWPDLLFESEEYHPKYIDELNKWITENNKDEVEIDENKKRITLLKPIILQKKGGNQ